MRKIVSMLSVLLLAGLLVVAQTRQITGRVTDEKGNPIPFSTITEKGTKNGVAADANGEFVIKVKSASAIVISSSGFDDKEVSIQGVSRVNVQLTGSIRTMDEVIVTAGGIKTKRKELGTTTTLVSQEALTSGKPTNIANGLQGRVAGFQVSGTGGGVNPTYRLILRGQRSLTGNNQALVVLDNVVVPNEVLGNLNPGDVENIVVLNGAGAAALYGSQASNGAIIVTTKKGKRGAPVVTVSNTTTIESVAFFPKIQKKFGAGGTAYGLDANGNPLFNYLENQSYGPAFDGVKRPLGPALEDGSQDSAAYAYNPGHFKFWEKGVTNQTDFSVSNGDENSTFYLSGQYANVTGTTPGDKYNRAVVRFNGTRKLGNTINVTYTSSYTQNRYDITTQTGAMYANMLNMPSNVDITRYKNWRTDKFANPNGYYNPWYQNPYFTADNYRSASRNDYLVGSIEIRFTPVKGLDFVGRQGISTRNYSNKNTTGAFDYTTFAENTDASSKSDISASVSDGSYYTTNLKTDLFTQYKTRLSDYSVDFVGGLQLNQDQAKSLNMTANGLVIPDLYNVNNGVGTPTVSEANYKARSAGVYGDIRIGYNNYLFLHATGRNDWVSVLAKANRSFFYPSVDLSFVASDAISALKNSEKISYLKFRAGWSKVGQVNLSNAGVFGAYALEPIFTTAYGFPYGSLPGYTVGDGLVSNDLKPEITKGYEVGFDLNMLKDRFTSTVTWFDTKTDNQTLPVSISYTSGFGSLLTNTGQTESRGLELTAHYSILRNTKWQVTIGGNYAYLDNKVNSISAVLPSLLLSGSATGGGSWAIAGKAFPVIMGYDYVRDNAGHVIVDATTGLPTKSSGVQILGNAQAKDKLGLDANASYKNFHFSVLFEYRGGYKIYNSMGPELDWSGTGYRTAVYDRKSFVFPNSVYEDPTKPGTYITNTSVAIANGNGNNGFWTDGINRDVTSNYVTSGNFWKLREVAISYDLPSSLLKKTKFIKNVTISLQGRNLLLWMPKDNLYTDPEYSTAGSDNNGIGITGLDSAPPSRFYGGTISFTF